jgi:hypothetical protein
VILHTKYTGGRENDFSVSTPKVDGREERANDAGAPGARPRCRLAPPLTRSTPDSLIYSVRRMMRSEAAMRPGPRHAAPALRGGRGRAARRGLGEHRVYPIVTPVRGELKTNRTYGLLVHEFYF